MAKFTAWENIVLLIIVEDVKKWQNYSLEKVHPTLHNSVSINLGEPTNQHPGCRKRQKNPSTLQKLQPRTTN